MDPERKKFFPAGITGEHLKEIYRIIDELQDEVRELTTEVVWMQSERD